MAFWWRGYGWMVMLGAVTWPLALSQRIVQPPIAPPSLETPGVDHGRSEDEAPFGNREMQARQMRRLREEHQRQVVADTTRLLQLATTLKEEADKGTKPSPGTLKNVDEIAKLAKRLSERIKNE